MILKTKQDVRFAELRFAKLQDKLKNKYSPTEHRFAGMLNKSGIFFSRERANITIGTRWCYFDFYIPVLNLFIELDGPEHLLPQKKEIDEDKTRIAESKNPRNFLIRFTNDEVWNLQGVDYVLLLRKMVEVRKVNGSLAYIEKWLNNQIKGYDLMNKNRMVQFGDIMTRPALMYDHDTNSIMQFESVFDMHNYTRIKCRDIVKRLKSNKVLKFIDGRFAFAFDIDSLFEKMNFIWDGKLICDEIPRFEIRPFKEDLLNCAELMYKGAIKSYFAHETLQLGLFDQHNLFKHR